jgi:hypothetical protein
MQFKPTFAIKNFSGGMATNPDAGDLSPNIAREARNVDLTKSPGCLRKSTGSKIFDPNNQLFNGRLESGDQILSVGQMTFNRVWAAESKINRPSELLVIQVKGSKGFDWYELERSLETGGQWFIEGPFYCGWDDLSPYDKMSNAPNFIEEFGVSDCHDRPAKWLSDKGVLRAALGDFMYDGGEQLHPMFNKSDSFPLQWRYVNRQPKTPVSEEEVNAYFKRYDSAHPQDGWCLHEFADLVRGVGLPDYTPDLEIVDSPTGGTPHTWHLGNNFGYANANVKYAILAEYDGHQVADLKVDPFTIGETVSADPYYTWGTKLRLTIRDYEDGAAFPKRLSGFRLYRSHQNLGIQAAGEPALAPSLLPPYQEIARFDIQDGYANVINLDAIFLNFETIGSNTYARFKYFYLVHPSQNIDVDFYKDLTAKFTDDNDADYESDIYSSSGGIGIEWIFIYVKVPTPNPSLTYERHYTLQVNSRWRQSATNVVLDFIDLNQPTSAAVPNWIDPNKARDELPRIDCNYSQARIFADTMWVTGVNYDDEKRQFTIRYSHRVNDPLAGFDLQPRYINISADYDEKLVGIRPHHDFLLVGTKRRLFKYLLLGDGTVEVLAEQPWDSGVNSIDAYAEVDGVSYFIGKRGDRSILYVWEPNSKPRPLDHIRDKLETILAMPDIDLDAAQVMPILRDDKVLFSIPTAEIIAPTNDPRWMKINNEDAEGLRSVGGNYTTQKTLGILPIAVGALPAGTVIVGRVDNPGGDLYSPIRGFYYLTPGANEFVHLKDWELAGGGPKSQSMSFVVRGTYIHAVSTWENLDNTSKRVYYGKFNIATMEWQQYSGGEGYALETLTGVDDAQYYPDIDVDPNDSNHIIVVWRSYVATGDHAYTKQRCSQNGGLIWFFTYSREDTGGSQVSTIAPSVAFDANAPGYAFVHWATGLSSSKLMRGLWLSAFYNWQELANVNMPNACMCAQEGQVGFLDVNSVNQLVFRYWSADEGISDWEYPQGISSIGENANQYALTYTGTDEAKQWDAFYYHQINGRIEHRARLMGTGESWNAPSPQPDGEDGYYPDTAYDHFGTLNGWRPAAANPDHAHVWAIAESPNAASKYDWWYRSGPIAATLIAQNVEIDKNGAVMMRGDADGTILAVRGWARLSDDSIIYHNNYTFYQLDPDSFKFADQPVAMYWEQVIPTGRFGNRVLHSIRAIYEYPDSQNADSYTITIKNEKGGSRTITMATTESGKEKMVDLMGREFTWILSHNLDSDLSFRRLEGMEEQWQ